MLQFDTNQDVLLVLYCGPLIASIRDPATHSTHFTLTSQPLGLRGGVGGQFPRNLNWFHYLLIWMSAITHSLFKKPGKFSFKIILFYLV